MPRLPLAPPLRPDEALSSWVARIAVRYDLSAYDLVRHLLPKADDVAEMLRWLDYRPVAPLEATLVEAADQPAAGFSGHRLTGLTTTQRRYGLVASQLGARSARSRMSPGMVRSTAA